MVAQKKVIETALEKYREKWSLYSSFSPKNKHLSLSPYGTMARSQSGRKFGW